MSWMPFEQGQTIGKKGPEGGHIIKDVEHPDGARITLETQCKMAPIAITCGIYGWMVHTVFYADQMTADDDFARMQVELERVAAMRADENLYAHVDAFHEALEAFQTAFQ